MPRSVADIVADLDALNTHDFELERLNELCDELIEANEPPASAPAMFRTMERLEDADLGSPGPLVHTLESWTGGYEELLAQSVQRKPTVLSLWMVNRILNASPPDAESWLAVLRSVLVNRLHQRKPRRRR